MKLRWRFGIIAGLFLAIFSLYPQFKMIYLRGSDWNGHYAYNDIDEVAYAAYLKAVIDGRPRKNDPYTGRDDTAADPQPESLFSIQFVGPYTIAIPARVFGIGAPWAMTISGAVAAFLTALAIFWLIGMISGDSLFAMAASLFVLCGGALFAGEGAIGEVLGSGFSYPYFPGFRRYIPAMAFPAFFALMGLAWRLFGDQITPVPASGATGDESLSPAGPSQPVLTVSLAALAFGYVVFSYFYVWTTAAAFFGCLGVCFLIARPAGCWRDIKLLAALGAGCLVFLAPYAYMLSNRSHTMDDVQMLVRTHAPDLMRVPELIGLIAIVVIAIGVLLKKIELIGRGTLFAISLALTPFIVFNQQIVTGQSLQPIHYQVFIGNYVAGLAIVVTRSLIRRRDVSTSLIGSRMTATALALMAVVWGFVECHYTVRVLDDVNVVRDEALPVARRLVEIAGEQPEPHKAVVLELGLAEADDLPTIAPQAVLWARHQHVFAGVTWQENKERYYQQLYYEGVSDRQLADGMKRGDDFVSMIALFGWGRHTDRLNSDYKPLTFREIDEEARKYSEYVKAFAPTAPGAVNLDYLVVSTSYQPYLESIDKWYERDAGETFGKYILYRLRLR